MFNPKKSLNMELANTLRTLLRSSVVRFTFVKVNGELRHAIGTRNLSIARKATGCDIPTPKGEEQPNSYFDLEKMGWRSYRPDSLVSIDEVIPYEREIPVEKATPKDEKPLDIFDLPTDLGTLLGNIFGTPLGGSPVSSTPKPLGSPVKEKAHKAFEDLGKDIKIVLPDADADLAKRIATLVVDEIAHRLAR